MVESMAPNSFCSSTEGVSSHEHEDGTQSCCLDPECVYSAEENTNTVDIFAVFLTTSDAFRKTGTSSYSDVIYIIYACTHGEIISRDLWTGFNMTSFQDTLVVIRPKRAMLQQINLTARNK